MKIGALLAMVNTDDCLSYFVPTHISVVGPTQTFKWLFNITVAYDNVNVGLLAWFSKVLGLIPTIVINCKIKTVKYLSV
jgi:hypothetical protein